MEKLVVVVILDLAAAAVEVVTSEELAVAEELVAVAVLGKAAVAVAVHLTSEV